VQEVRDNHRFEMYWKEVEWEERFTFLQYTRSALLHRCLAEYRHRSCTQLFHSALVASQALEGAESAT
jgi:hypothetical protein